MAGAGYKTFNAGDVLLASDVNTYLMQQTVMVFATSGARTTALASPAEGMLSYLLDANTLELFDGTNWVIINSVGAWTSYTPALTPSTNSFTTLTYTTQLGAYQRLGKTVHFRAFIEINAITVGTASGVLRVSLPFAAKTATGLVQTVSGKYFDASTSTPYRIVWSIGSGSSLCVNALYNDNNHVTTTAPTALATGDQFMITGTYEID